MEQRSGSTCLVGICVLALILGSACNKKEIDASTGKAHTVTSGLSGTLTIMGSESMDPIVSRWERGYSALYPTVRITGQRAGSETGPVALLEGKTQIAAMSRRFTPQERISFKQRYGEEPAEVPVAMDAVAIYLHAKNPIARLTLQELATLFCEDHARRQNREIRTWGDLGLSNEWATESIRLYGRNSRSGTATFFREHVCGGGEFKKSMVAVPDGAAVVLEVLNDRFAIGFNDIGHRASLVKVVPLALGAKAPAIEPSFQSVMNRSYLLSRYLYLYVRRDVRANVSLAWEFIRFALSREGQEIVVQGGFYPLPPPELSQQLAVWSQLMKAHPAD